MSDPSNAHSGIGALLTPQNSEFVIKPGPLASRLPPTLLALADDVIE